MVERLARPGDRVRKGQILVRVDSDKEPDIRLAIEAVPGLGPAGERA
jgi:multidrug efflux pump subunit AcrA (membrane-fusion protein)